MVHDSLGFNALSGSADVPAGLPSDGRLLLRPSEVADALALGRTTVYGMIQRGELPTLRIGAAVRIPIDALREWIAERTVSMP